MRTEGPTYRKTFILGDVQDSVIQEFYAGTAEVNVRNLFDSYRTLRAFNLVRQSLSKERNRNSYAQEASRQ